MAITTLGYGAFPAGNIIQVQSTTTNTAVSNTDTASNLDLMRLLRVSSLILLFLVFPQIEKLKMS